MFTLAHLSDIHLSPFKRPRLRELMNKRLLGYLNWQRRRKYIHLRSALDLLISDLKEQNYDHIALTGDLVNLALEEEYEGAASWLEALACGDKMTVVPGNHDAYIKPEKALEEVLILDDQGDPLHHWVPPEWAAYMGSNEAGRSYVSLPDKSFPFVRIFGKIALIGLSSAVPQPIFKAAGILGERQQQELKWLLSQLGEEQFFRIVLIHHPPFPGMTAKRCALQDSEALREIILSKGAELVLYGHTHNQSVLHLQTSTGPCHVVQVPSASTGQMGRHPLAQYHLFNIEVLREGWQVEMVGRGLEDEKGNIVETGRRVLRERSHCAAPPERL